MVALADQDDQADDACCASFAIDLWLACAYVYQTQYRSAFIQCEDDRCVTTKCRNVILHEARLVRSRLLCKIRSWHDPQCAFKRLWRFLEQKKRLAASVHEEFSGAAFGSSQHRIKRARSLRP